MPGGDEFTYGDSTCRFSKTPQNILIIKRPKSPHATLLASEISSNLTKIYNATVYCEEEAINDMKEIDKNLSLISISNIRSNLGEIIDLAISLGGDGTLLWLSHLFQTLVPPVVSIAMGSLGYMSLFHFSKAHEIIDRIMQQRTFAVSLRSRLTLYIPQENNRIMQASCLNECVFERGNRHCLASIDVYCSGCYFTRVFADGLILATPSGSTAYSMSAGGSIVHPKVSGILFTPICPHTLSFRPVILPGSTELLIHVPESSRDGVQVAIDGRRIAELKNGQFAAVTMCSYPLPLVICPQMLDSSTNSDSNAESKSIGRHIDSTYTYQDILNEINETKNISRIEEYNSQPYENLVFVCPCCRRPDDCVCGIEPEISKLEEEMSKKQFYREDYWLDSLNHSLDWNSQRAAQIPVDMQEIVSSSKYSEFQSSLKKHEISNYSDNVPLNRKTIPQSTKEFLEQVRVIWKHDNEFKHECLPDDNNTVTCLNSKDRYQVNRSQKTIKYDENLNNIGESLDNTSIINSSVDFDSCNWSQKSNNTDSTIKSTKSKTPFFTPVKIPGVIILDRKI